MKKLLFVVTASFFSATLYAQTEPSTTHYDDFAPKELKCTEEAISFRVNIRPGLGFYSFRLGYTDYPNGTSGFPSSKNPAGDDLTIEPLQLLQYENATNRQNAYPNMNFLFPEKTIKALMQASQFAGDLFFIDYYNSFQSSSFNFVVHPLN